jgi:hypothetical protein
MSATPAKDALLAALDTVALRHADDVLTNTEVMTVLLTNRSLVLAALVEQAPLTDDELRVLGGVSDDEEYDHMTDTWEVVWRFPRPEEADQ